MKLHCPFKVIWFPVMKTHLVHLLIRVRFLLLTASQRLINNERYLYFWRDTVVYSI